MVQIVDSKAKPSRRDYWKLDHGPSRSKKALLLLMPSYRAYKSTDLARLRFLYFRCQRGLLSYEGLTASELKIFIEQRALPPGVDKRPTASNFKRVLELADDDATFDGFSNLLPELRLQIYEHYFDWLKDSSNPICGGQPPITVASRQTRQEALSLFYSSCRFTLQAEVDQLTNPRPCYDAQNFLNKTSADNIACIRFLTLSLNGSRKLVVGKNFVTFEIDFTNDECGAKISSFDYEKCEYYTEDKTTVIDRANERLVLETQMRIWGVAARGGLMKAEKNDVSFLFDSTWSALQRGLDNLP
jgi:hypothetical protein